MSKSLDQKLVAAPVSRRTMFAGAGTVGAAAAVAALLPRSLPGAGPVASAAPDAAPGEGGYRLSEHVQHYYRTARV